MELYMDTVLKGTVTDATYTTSSFIAIWCTGPNTDANHNAMFDDIYYYPPVNPPIVTLTTPNGGENWLQGSSQTITWNPATQGDFPLKANPITLYYSTTGPGGPWTQIATGLPNTGSYSPWVVPSVSTATAYVRVMAEDDQVPSNPGFDISNGAFTMYAVPPSVTLTAPNGGEVWIQSTSQTITWNPATPNTWPLKANPITLSYSTTGPAGPWTQIATNVANTGSYTPWIVPSVSTTNAFVKIDAADDRSPANVGSDTSNAAFTISSGNPPTVTVTKPNGGEKWFIQGAYDVTFTVTAGTFPLAANPITIYYSVTGPAGPWTQIAANLPNVSPYNWSVPAGLPPSINAYIKVEAKDDRPTPNVGSDISNAAFTLATASSPTVTVTKPNGGEVWAINTTNAIKWTAAQGTFPLAANPITIYYSTAGPTGPWTQLFTNVLNNGTYNWKVPAPPSPNSYVKVEAKDDRPTPNLTNDTSNAAFNITTAIPPSVKVTFPNGGETFSIGTPIDITWTATNGTYQLAANPITIWYSSNGSGGPWSLVVANQPNSGKYTWGLPMTPSNTSCIKVGAVDTQGNSGSDICDADFKIVPGNAPPYLTMVSPTGGEIWRGTKEVVWDGADANKNTVTYYINISADGGGTWISFNTSTFAENATVVEHMTFMDTNGYADGISYRIKIDADDHNGSVVSKSTLNFTIDNNPPKSSVEPLTPYVKSTTFTVKWNGSDSVSGIDRYDIYYSADQGTFTKWTSTANKSGTFTGTEGHRYGFYSVGVDKAGNSETKMTEEAWTRIDAIAPVTNVVPLPKFVGSATFNVSYNVTDPSPVNATLYYNKDGTGWKSYGNFSKSPISFATQGEGKYEFYVQGVDAAGNKESKGQTAEASTVLDLTPPATKISLKLPPSKRPVYNASDVTVYFDASDNLELQSVKVLCGKSADNITWGAWQECLTYPTPGLKAVSKAAPAKLQGDGYYRLKAGTVDAAGNIENATAMLYLRVDSVPPEISGSSPADGTKGVKLAVDANVTFSESMDRASVEKAISVSNYSKILQFSWDSSSSRVSFGLSNLADNATYTIAVSSLAKDIAGNRLKRVEIAFMTVPTCGSVSGRAIGSDSVYLKGIKVALSYENGTKSAETTTDSLGNFAFYEVLAGNYTVSSSASGYESSSIKVTVVAGQGASVTITLQKNNTGLYIGIGAGIGVLVFFLLFLFLVVLKKRRKCPKCGMKAKRRVEVCPKCGTRIPPVQAAAKPRKKLMKKDGKAEHQPAEGEVPPVPMPATIYSAPKVPTKCPSCKEDVPAGEEWCPNCGAMVARPEGAQNCPKCGNTMSDDGSCPACGLSPASAPALLPEIDMRQPGQECPRCYAPLESGSKFCSICGGDVEKLMTKQKKKEERVAVMKADAKLGAKIDVGKAKAPPPLGIRPQVKEPAQPPDTVIAKTEPAKVPPTTTKPGFWPVRAPPIPTPPKTEPAKAPPVPTPSKAEPAQAPPVPIPPKTEPTKAPPIPRPTPATTPPGPKAPDKKEQELDIKPAMPSVAPMAPKHGPATPPPAVAPVHTVPPAAIGTRCKTCNSPVPVGSKWCDVCGEKV